MADSTVVHDTWSTVREPRLADYLCLWQDLDGVHIASAPEEAPETSILWAWPTSLALTAPVSPPFGLRSEDPTKIWRWQPRAHHFDPPLIRIRIDGETAYVATLTDGVLSPVVPWGNEAQVDGLHVFGDSAGSDLAERCRRAGWIEVREALPTDGAQPVTFLCPAAST